MACTRTLPECRAATPLVQAINIQPGESVQAILDVSSFDGGEDILFATRMGRSSAWPWPPWPKSAQRNQTTMDVEPGDQLVSVRLASESDDVIMVSQHGMSVRFPAAQVRRSSRIAGGVRGMRLKDDDIVVAMDVVEEGLRPACHQPARLRQALPHGKLPPAHRSNPGAASG